MFKVLLTMTHVLVSLVLVLVVLLQTGKRADLAGAFGGGGSQTAFGTRGAATFLSKATTVCAVLFMVTSLSLSILSSRPDQSGVGTVLGEDAPPASTAPLEPGPPVEAEENAAPTTEAPPEDQDSLPGDDN